MILFAGIPSEAPMAMAIAAAERLGLRHVVLNQRHSEHVGIGLSVQCDGLSGEIRIAGSPHRLAAFSGIYARAIETAVLPEVVRYTAREPLALGALRIQATNDLLVELLDIAPCRVANRPGAMGSNFSKPFQAQLIEAAGLRTPETLITNLPDAVRDFHARHGRLIYKSVSAIRSIVREWDPQGGSDLARIRTVPTQFQAFVPGVNVRVHVVGTSVLATEIDSDAIDYRYAEREGGATSMHPIELPAVIAGKCVDLTARLGLVLSGIDLKRTPDGEWYCFEVNPSPAYSYFEELGGQPIAEALVRHLAEEA